MGSLHIMSHSSRYITFKHWPITAVSAKLSAANQEWRNIHLKLLFSRKYFLAETSNGCLSGASSSPSYGGREVQNTNAKDKTNRKKEHKYKYKYKSENTTANQRRQL